MYVACHCFANRANALETLKCPTALAGIEGSQHLAELSPSYVWVRTRLLTPREVLNKAQMVDNNFLFIWTFWEMTFLTMLLTLEIKIWYFI